MNTENVYDGVLNNCLRSSNLLAKVGGQTFVYVQARACLGTSTGVLVHTCTMKNNQVGQPNSNPTQDKRYILFLQKKKSISCSTLTPVTLTGKPPRSASV